MLITTRPCALHETEIDYDQQRIHRAANPLPVMVQQDPPTQPMHIPDSHDERHLAATVAALRISFAFLILPQISVEDRLRKVCNGHCRTLHTPRIFVINFKFSLTRNT